MSSLTFLGLCLKAGKLEIGEESCGAAARAKKARLLLSASDAAHGSLMRAQNFAETAKAPHVLLPFTKAELGAAVGRGTPGMLAVTDYGLAAAFTERLASECPGRYDEAAALLQAAAVRALQRKREKQRHAENKRKGKK